jgi:signal transduction histidine kinase
MTDLSHRFCGDGADRMAEITNEYPDYVPVADDLQGRAVWPAYRRLSRQELTVFGVGVAAAAGAAAIIATGGVVTYSDAFAAVLVANIVGLTIAGLLWLHARPWNRLGAVLLQLAITAFFCSFAGASSPVLFLVGNVALWLFALGVVWSVAAFPSGRLDAGGRVLVAFAAVVFVGIGLPQLFVTQQNLGVAFVGRCFADCPRNLLLVSSSPDVAHHLKVAQGIGRSVLSVAIVVLFASRYARASRPRRRIVLPVYVVSLLYAAGFAVNGIAVDALGDSAQPGVASRFAIVGARILFPFGFVAAILLAHAYAGTALAGMARELGDTTSATGIEALVRRVLDDTSARLGFWVSRFGTFTDLQGRALELDPAQEWRTWRCFDRGGERVLALEHDAALADDPELVQAVGSAALIGLENRRLQRNLLDSIEELRASRRRLVVAAAGERRRIEQNLHDGTQQRLVALRIQLELAREQAPSGSALRARLAQMGNDLSESLDELRAVAHGIYPQLLTDEGLPAALHDTAPRIGIPVDVETEDVGRFAEDAEVALYYTCLEALQNAVKHGGDDVSARVTVRREGRTLYFRVADTGVGFAIRHRRGGTGLTNMTDRIGAVGGSIAIRSAPGRGTTVEGRIPLEHGRR